MAGLWTLLRQWLPFKPAVLGRWGEDYVAQYLVRQGFRIIARNWRSGKGELDIVAGDPDGAIAVVEVKTRKDEGFAPATAAMTYHKKKMLIRTAKSFMRQYQISDKPLRFDVITVIGSPGGKPQMKHYRNAFTG